LVPLLTRSLGFLPDETAMGCSGFGPLDPMPICLYAPKRSNPRAAANQL
jgi:hypothetical protein